MQPQVTPHFWFEELTLKQHFATDAALDETIRVRFGAKLEAAAPWELGLDSNYLTVENIAARENNFKWPNS